MVKQFFTLRFLKFAVVGSTAAAINYALYISLPLLGIWYIYAAMVGFVLSAIFNFTANKFWTFSNNHAGMAIFSQGIKFSIVMVSGLLINISIIYCLTEFSGLDKRLSWLFATGCVTAWSFSFNRLWTFKDKAKSAGILEEKLK